MRQLHSRLIASANLAKAEQTALEIFGSARIPASVILAVRKLGRWAEHTKTVGSACLYLRAEMSIGAERAPHFDSDGMARLQTVSVLPLFSASGDGEDAGSAVHRSPCRRHLSRLRALCNCDLELPVEHRKIPAISQCLYPRTS